MDSNFNTFFVLSNVNTRHTVFTPDTRFIQTVKTLESIHLKAPGSRILFCDNSDIPLTDGQIGVIKQYVDVVVDYNNTLFTNNVNSSGKNKGLNELLVYEGVLRVARSRGLIGRRIFKISGRYELMDNFDILEYDKPYYVGKYVFRITPWIYNEGAGETIKYFYNTALWSMCTTLISDYAGLMQTMFNYMLHTGENIEMAHNAHIPKDKLILVPNVHGHGFMAGGEYTRF